MKKLTLKTAEIINNKCDPTHISNLKRIYRMVGQQQKKPNMAGFEQFFGKKEQSSDFPGHEGLKKPLI